MTLIPWLHDRKKGQNVNGFEIQGGLPQKVVISEEPFVKTVTLTAAAAMLAADTQKSYLIQGISWALSNTAAGTSTGAKVTGVSYEKAGTAAVTLAAVALIPSAANAVNLYQPLNILTAPNTAVTLTDLTAGANGTYSVTLYYNEIEVQ